MIKKSFRDTRIYPIFFMVILTVIFIGILAAFYQSTLDRVELYRELNYKKAIISLFGYPQANIKQVFKNNFKQIKNPELNYYEATENGKITGYVFDISGSGLWGTINALIAVSPNFKKIISIDILSQNETPGLGGRITENWFKNQFRNKELINRERITWFKLVAEGEKTKINEVNQITGATFSSKAMVDMIYKEMQRITEQLGVNYE